MAPLTWQQYTERMIGKGHPTLADTNNRALRELLEQSGYDPDADPFPGLMGPVFNVKAFGALGDGVTDNAAAFLAAQAAAAAADGHVYVPPGSYGVAFTELDPDDSSIRIGIPCVAGVSWFGGGDGAEVIALSSDMMLFDVKVADVHFLNLKLTGDGVESPHRAVAVRYKGAAATRGSVVGCVVSDWGTHGLMARAGANDILFARNFISGSVGWNGIELGASSEEGPDRVSVVQNVIFDNADQGIEVRRATGTVIVGNLIRDNGFVQVASSPKCGIGLEETGEAIVANNVVIGNAQDGIQITGLTRGATGNVVVGNKLTGNGRYGLRLAGESVSSTWHNYQYNLIQGNIVRDNATAGIRVSAASDNSILDNTVEGNPVGIQLVSFLFADATRREPVNTVVRGNRIVANDEHGIITDRCHDSVFTGNHIADNNVSAGAFDGINISTADDCLIQGNVCIGQRYGVRIIAGNRITMAHNELAGTTGAALIDSNLGHRAIDNNGYTTQGAAARGDVDVTLTSNDQETQRFATALTANRTVTLPASGNYNGQKFRVVRTGLGAFTLDVGGLKTIPSATAAFVDALHDGTAWRLAAYGAL